MNSLIGLFFVGFPPLPPPPLEQIIVCRFISNAVPLGTCESFRYPSRNALSNAGVALLSVDNGSTYSPSAQLSPPERIARRSNDVARGERAFLLRCVSARKEQRKPTVSRSMGRIHCAAHVHYGLVETREMNVRCFCSGIQAWCSMGGRKYVLYRSVSPELNSVKSWIKTYGCDGDDQRCKHPT